MGFSFRKEERLKKRKDIQELFNKGSSFYLYPFKVYALPGGSAPFHQVLISVSSKNFKRAVDRNLIKRRVREAYRLQKHKLPENKLVLGFIYTAKEILPFREIENKVLLALSRLEKFRRDSNDSIQRK
jgi:ribonuclease P protein component